MTTPPERLFTLLPAIHRLRDAERGEPLRALMALFEEQLDAIEADVESLWDNWFIETCEEWLVSYIGATVGVSGLRDVPATGFSLRAYVANTLARRQRKGTAAATEALARDVTGYPCRAVELFALTATTVHVNHARRVGADGAGWVPTGTADLRDPVPLEQVGSAFDAIARTADVRPLDGIVRHNLPNLALFLWRAVPEEVSMSSARPIPGRSGWYRFDPLGADLPLFNLPLPEEDIAALATPAHVPHPLGRQELARLSPDADPPVVVRTTSDARGAAVLELGVCHLGDVDGDLPSYRPSSGTAAVDPVFGRLVLAEDDVPTGDGADVLVDMVTAAPGRIGAGTFDRGTTWARQFGDVVVARQWGVGRDGGPVADEPFVSSLDEAVDGWNAWIMGRPAEERASAVGVVVLTDSRRHEAPGAAITLPDGARLYIVAGQWPIHDDGGVLGRVIGEVIPNLARPHVVGDIHVAGTPAAGAARPGGLWLNGVLLEGAISVDEGDLDAVDVAQCTIVGSPSVAVTAGDDGGNARLTITLRRCITASITADGPVAGLVMEDTAVGGGDAGVTEGAITLPGAGLELTGCTVVGAVHGRTLDASDCILDEGDAAPEDAVDIAVTQEGCVRFSYVPSGATTPRRHRCQPDRVLEAVSDPDRRARLITRMRPVYQSDVLGAPGFLLLHPSCPEELRTAASDGGEPGVWHHIGHALRMANLRAALRQYLRFGLEAGVVFDR